MAAVAATDMNQEPLLLSICACRIPSWKANSFVTAWSICCTECWIDCSSLQQPSNTVSQKSVGSSLQHAVHSLCGRADRRPRHQVPVLRECVCAHRSNQTDMLHESATPDELVHTCWFAPAPPWLPAARVAAAPVCCLAPPHEHHRTHQPLLQLQHWAPVLAPAAEAQGELLRQLLQLQLVMVPLPL